jgi:hypothetical protein
LVRGERWCSHPKFCKKIKVILLKTLIFINMGRKLKKEEERKIKFGISLDRDIFNLMTQEKIKKSTLIEKLLKEYYAKKNL